MHSRVNSALISTLKHRTAKSMVQLPFVVMLVLSCLWAPTVLADSGVSVFEPEISGDFVQGAMIVGRTAPNAEVKLNGNTLKVGHNGHFVFGIGRDDKGDIELMITGAAGERWQQQFSIQSREFNIQRVDGLPQRTVTPDPEVQALIRADNAKIGAARDINSNRLNFTESFVWPAEGRISGVYGSQRILNGNPSAPHWGLDIAAPTGTPVYAPAGGEVRLTAPDMVLSGGTIIIDHGHNIFSSFLHLHAIHVEEGQIVEPGDLIGEIGATGRATGPHLDWRMNWGSVRVDPALLLPERD
ncbi:metalloendopeptidase-like membrane protein [Idiomarina sp. A28L]|uniref:M23 family metallopeptidase n=1 Tax=Idiomarina sp. A28L TaxID=1036674 RepID=UPI0002138907|nr:M23 family metallopeptidase [Idiomarina sp. A28L]EGN75772.1 metalloendopeptidase-like membrane protein [Idiomarina sp. A28L]